MEKFQISVKNLNNLWSFIEIYAVFALNLCEEKMTNMRSDRRLLGHLASGAPAAYVSDAGRVSVRPTVAC